MNENANQLGSQVVNQIVASLMPQLIEALLGALTGLLSKKHSEPPIATPAVPNPVRLPDDDFIAPPAHVTSISKVVIRLQKAQYSAKLFPDMYTEANPQGLYDNPGQYEDGKSALNRESKVWLDLTAYDANGNELGGDQIKALGISFKTEHIAQVGDKVTRITGKGSDANGSPLPWDQVEDTFMGLGITSWQNSLGFNEQMKAWGEGSVVCSGSVNGIKSNSITLRFS